MTSIVYMKGIDLILYTLIVRCYEGLPFSFKSLSSVLLVELHSNDFMIPTYLLSSSLRCYKKLQLSGSCHYVVCPCSALKTTQPSIIYTVVSNYKWSVIIFQIFVSCELECPDCYAINMSRSSLKALHSYAVCFIFVW